MVWCLLRRGPKAARGSGAGGYSGMEQEGALVASGFEQRHAQADNRVIQRGTV